MALRWIAFYLPGAATGVMLAILGTVVLRASPRDRANRLFAAYCLLVAANYALNALGAVLEPELLAPLGPVGPRRALVEAAYALEILDPVALFFFAGEYPRRNVLGDRRWRFLVAGTALVLEGLLLADPVGWTSGNGSPLHQAFVTVVYVAVFAGFLGTQFRRPVGSEPLLPDGFLLGFAVVVFLRIGFAFNLAYLAIPLSSPFSLATAGNAFAGFLLFLATTGVVLTGAVGQRGREVLALVRRASVVWVLLVLVLALPAFITDTGVSRGPIANAFADLALFSRYTIRWWVFAVAVGPAILRNQVFELETRLRRGLLVGAVSGVLLATFFAAAVLIEGSIEDAGSVPVKIVLILALLVLVASQSAALGRRLADAWFPPLQVLDEAYRRARRIEIYHRAALAVADGRLPEADLARLRERLQLSPGEARLAAALSSSRASPIGPGVVLRGRYRLLRLVGRGGHGRVFLARDLRDARDVAVKEISRGTQELGGARGIEQEVAAALRLRHPNVLSAVDFFVDGEAAYVVTPFMAHGSLEDLLGRGAVDPKLAAEALVGLLRGLEHAHDRGFLHRDVKPSNLLRDGSGVWRLADFGVAVAPVHDRTMTSLAEGGVAGTLAYLPPEAFQGASPSPQSDIFAAGTTLLKILAPEEPLDRAELPPRVPPELQAVIARARARDPTQRYPTASAMRHDLEHYLVKARRSEVP